MTYYKVAVIKTVCYRYKDRQYRSVKQKKGVNISLFVYSVNFHKGVFKRKDNLFNK